MGFLGLCGDKEEPVVAELRAAFNANILKVPGEHVKPLGVVAFSREGIRYLGDLAPLLETGTPLQLPSGYLEEARMATVSGHRTGSVKLDLGLKILDGFLSGFGIASAEVCPSFEAVSRIAFSFQDVRRTYLQTTRLGRLLADKKIDQTHPLARLFQGERSSDFLVLDMVIQSNNFAVHVEKAEAKRVKLDLPNLAQFVGGVRVNVGSTSESDLTVTFAGDKYLTFAFSCVRLYPDEQGQIHLIAPEYRKISLAGRGLKMTYNPDHALLSEEPGLLDLETS